MGEELKGGYEPEFFKDVLHDGPGHHNTYVITFVQPLADEVLDIGLVFHPGYNTMKA